MNQDVLFESIRRRIAAAPENSFPFDFERSAQVLGVSRVEGVDNPLFMFDILFGRETAPRYRVVAKQLDPRKTAPDALNREFTLLSRLHVEKRLTDRGYRTPRPLARYDDLRTILMERVDGERLSAYIRRKNSLLSPASRQSLEKTICRCGDFLRIYHSVTKTGDPCIPPESVLEELFGKIRTTYDRLPPQITGSENGSARFLDCLSRAEELMRKTEYQLVIQHGDFYPGNILVDGNNLYLLDFAFSKTGLIHSDIVRFLFMLEFLNPYPQNLFYDFRKIGLYRRVFLDAYTEGAPAFTDMDRLAIHMHKVRCIVLHAHRRYVKYVSSALGGRLYFEALKMIYRRMIQREMQAVASLLSRLSQRMFNRKDFFGKGPRFP